jgi:hypothetical protein
MSARIAGATIVVLAAIGCDAEGLGSDHVASLASPEFAARARTAAFEPPNGGVSNEPRLVRQGTISLDVDSVGDTIREIGTRIEAQGGFIASCSELANEDRKSADLVLRIPSPRFDTTFAQLRTLGELANARIETTDVADAYADLELRLGVKRRTEARLRDLLGRGTAKLADVLEVERELERRVEEIEALERQIQRYDDQVALGIIQVHLQEPEGTGVFARVARAARSAGRSLAVSLELAVYGTVFVLPWLVAATLAWAIAGRLRRGRVA